MTAILGSCALGARQCPFIALTSQAYPTFIPLRFDRLWATGQTHAAIVRHLKAGAEGGGGFCEDSNGIPYFLRRTQGLFEGQSIQIEVTAEPRGDKSAAAEVYEGPPRHPSLTPCLARHGCVGPIEVMDLDLLRHARSAFPADHFILGSPDPNLQALAAETLELRAYDRDQVTLRWDQTPTAHHLDIDGSGSLAQINRTAADLAAQIIRGRNLGGILFLDFLAPPNKAERRALSDQVVSALSGTSHQLKVHTMNESGHLIVERQRIGPEFLETYYDDEPARQTLQHLR